MKYLTLILGLVLMGTGGFKSVSVTDINEDSWSEWKMSSCFLKIQYRTKKANYQPKDKDCYEVQVKNNYPNKVYFSYGLKASGDASEETSQRRNLETGAITTPLSQYVPKGSGFHFIVNKLRFDKDDKSPYAKCDR